MVGDSNFKRGLFSKNHKSYGTISMRQKKSFWGWTKTIFRDRTRIFLICEYEHIWLLHYLIIIKLKLFQFLYIHCKHYWLILYCNTIWIYFDVISLFWFLWAIFFVSKGANLSFSSVKLWIIQNDQLRPNKDNFGVVELIVTTLFHLHWELGQGEGRSSYLHHRA